METRLYQTDAEIRTMPTEVTAAGTECGGDAGVERHWVRLATTIFYPEGGGQPSDRGTIGEAAVGSVALVEGAVRHYVDRAVPCGPVETALDWARRFDHMQQHTGQHLLTAICEDRFGWPTTAFHLGETYANIDLDVAAIPAEALEAVEDAVNAAIRENHAVGVRFESAAAVERLIAMGAVRTRGLPDHVTDEIRLVEIEGVDLNTCGGTHVRTTAALQVCRLIDTERAKGGTRLRFLFGGRTIAWMREAARREDALRAMLGVPAAEFVETVAGWERERRASHKRLKETEEDLAVLLGASLARAKSTIAATHCRGRDAGFLRRVAGAMNDRAPDKTAVVFGDDGGAALFLVSAGDAATTDAAAIGRRILAAIEGRGGGKGKQFQGRGPDASLIPAALQAVHAVHE